MKKITDKLNELSVKYKTGELQKIRRELGNLTKRRKPIIFGRGVHEHYAFHSGGRLELQFNIGDDCYDRFRYGIAFSLETSSFVRDISPLYLKVERFNDYFRKNPEKFLEYQTFSQVKNKNVGTIEPVKVIEKEFYTKSAKTFIFIGKFFDNTLDGITNDEDYHTILRTFDDLLEVYEYVETKE